MENENDERVSMIAQTVGMHLAGIGAVHCFTTGSVDAGHGNKTRFDLFVAKPHGRQFIIQWFGVPCQETGYDIWVPVSASIDTKATLDALDVYLKPSLAAATASADEPNDAVEFLTHEIEHSDVQDEWAICNVPGGFYFAISNAMERYANQSRLATICKGLAKHKRVADGVQIPVEIFAQIMDEVERINGREPEDGTETKR